MNDGRRNSVRIADAVDELRRAFLECGMHAPISIEVADGDLRRLKEMFLGLPIRPAWTDVALVCGVKIREEK